MRVCCSSGSTLHRQKRSQDTFANPVSNEVNLGAGIWGKGKAIPFDHNGTVRDSSRLTPLLHRLEEVRHESSVSGVSRNIQISPMGLVV